MTPPPSAEVALARAIDDLEFARDAGRQGKHAIAISRSYYAALYASMALLASIGMHAKTHEGVRTLVNQHFVRTGKLPAETSMHLGQIEGARYEADYDLAAVFPAESANEIVERAALYVERIKALLAPA